MPQTNDMRNVVKKMKADANTAKRKATTTKSPEVQTALRDKYPQMYDKRGKLKPGYDGKKTKWTDTLKKKVKRVLKGRKKSTTSTRTKQVEKAAGKAITKKELDKLR